jgi:4-aminobutyrate aminotransferase-like enzyme
VVSHIRNASRIIDQLREGGILIGGAGSYGSTLKIRPPLCFSKENADMFVTACEDVLQEIFPSD